MWIKEYRHKYGLRRDALGKLADCSGELIRIVEYGGITHPRIADRIASVCGAGKNERNSIVDGAHWREGWKQIPKYLARGERAKKAYFLRLARQKKEKEKEKELAEQQRLQAKQSEGTEQPEPTYVEQPTGRERGSATSAEDIYPQARSCGQAERRPEPTEVYAINRLGEVVGRYPDCAAAARQYAVKPYTVESRCEHRIGKHTNEYFLSGVTFRYAAEWDRLNRDAQQSMVREAESSGGNKRRREPVEGEYSWQGQTHSVTEWARIAGMRKQTLHSRLAGGWDIEKALRTPVQSRES